MTNVEECLQLSDSTRETGSDIDLINIAAK